MFSTFLFLVKILTFLLITVHKPLINPLIKHTNMALIPLSKRNFPLCCDNLFVSANNRYHTDICKQTKWKSSALLEMTICRCTRWEQLLWYNTVVITTSLFRYLLFVTYVDSFINALLIIHFHETFLFNYLLLLVATSDLLFIVCAPVKNAGYYVRERCFRSIFIIITNISFFTMNFSHHFFIYKKSL